MPFCEKCGNEHLEGASFCKVCGARLDEPIEPSGPALPANAPALRAKDSVPKTPLCPECHKSDQTDRVSSVADDAESIPELMLPDAPRIEPLLTPSTIRSGAMLIVVIVVCMVLLAGGSSASSLLLALMILSFIALAVLQYRRYMEVAASRKMHQEWEHRRQRWQRLYYCRRCGKVFYKGDKQGLPPERIGELLARPE